MPLYDYECPHCGVIREVQHTVGEIGKIEILCDECGKPMKKMLSLPALIGFDNIGRSRSRKDREEVPKKDTTGKSDKKKETTPQADTKKDSSS